MTHPLFDGIAPIPDSSNRELDEFVVATLAYADQGRARLRLAPDKRMRITLPYSRDMEALFRQAEPVVAEHFVFFDWSRFERWDIPRDLAGDFDPATAVIGDPSANPRILLVKMPWAGGDEYTAEQARVCAAELMAAADHLDHLDSNNDKER